MSFEKEAQKLIQTPGIKCRGLDSSRLHGIYGFNPSVLGESFLSLAEGRREGGFFSECSFS